MIEVLIGMLIVMLIQIQLYNSVIARGGELLIETQKYAGTTFIIQLPK
jgi:hypothetical protein